MKAFRILGRNIRDSFKSVFRNFSLSLASISCITITLIVVSIAIILTFNVNNFTKLVEEDLTIVAFMPSDISQEQIDKIEKKIKAINGIESYEFQSKTKISEDMMESSDVFKNVMGNWTEEESPIQPTFLVKVKDIKNIGKIAKKIEKFENIKLVKYGEGMVEQLVSIFNIIKNISFGTVIALIVVTAFLITNTIKITIFSRKREIEIMRLVGASNINIKIPFFFEGLFLGIIGSILPIGITVFGYQKLYYVFGGKLFSDFIRLINPEPFIYIVSLALLVIGVCVGMIGSLMSVKKYLKI